MCIRRKVIVLGQHGVGKKSLVHRLSDNGDWPPRRYGCIGVDSMFRTEKVGGVTNKLMLWMTSGQERFGSLGASYYRGAHVALLCFDLSDHEPGLKDLETRWFSECEKFGHCRYILVGLKSEKSQKTSESNSSAVRLTLPRFPKSMHYIEVSAKTRENCDELVQLIVSEGERWDLDRDQFGSQPGGVKLPAAHVKVHERGAREGGTRNVCSWC